jgi:hypothetical protein
LWEENRILELVDPKVKDNCDEDQVLLLIQVALLCSQDTPALRPNMMRVVSILSGGDMEAAVMPVRPFSDSKPVTQACHLVLVHGLLQWWIHLTGCTTKTH